jgi:hypothetical protein
MHKQTCDQNVRKTDRSLTGDDGKAEIKGGLVAMVDTDYTALNILNAFLSTLTAKRTWVSGLLSTYSNPALPPFVISYSLWGRLS